MLSTIQLSTILGLFPILFTFCFLNLLCWPLSPLYKLWVQLIKAVKSECASLNYLMCWNTTLFPLSMGQGTTIVQDGIRFKERSKSGLYFTFKMKKTSSHTSQQIVIKRCSALPSKAKIKFQISDISLMCMTQGDRAFLRIFALQTC